MYDDLNKYENNDLYDDFEDADNNEYKEYAADDYDNIEDDEEDENALWDDVEEDTAEDDHADEPPKKGQRKRRRKTDFPDSDTDEAEAELNEKIQRQITREQQLIDELEDDAAEHPIEDDEDDSGEQPKRKLLKRELRAQALARLEDAARTPRDFENVIVWWDKLDANRQRRERYHELSRSGDEVPLEYGASEDALCFPDTLNNILERQQRKGDFIDAIFYCPYEMHELVSEEYMSNILRELSEDHNFLLFLCALRQYNSTRIAAIRGQTDRNIRKVRGTMLKKIRKKLLAALIEKVRKQQPLTLLEKEFLADNSMDIENNAEK